MPPNRVCLSVLDMKKQGTQIGFPAFSCCCRTAIFLFSRLSIYKFLEIYGRFLDGLAAFLYHN